MTKNNPIVSRPIVACVLASAAAAGHSFAADSLDTSGARLVRSTSVQDEETPELESDDRMFTLTGWEGAFALGLNGATGNNENFNARAGFDAHKETTRNEATLGLTYTYASSDGEQSENRFVARARYDWLLPDSKWRVFVIGSYEFDEFQDWDHRVSVGPGVGYRLIKNDKTNLLVRTAVLATREFGSDDDSWIAEVNPGLDFKHKLTERQTLTSSLDFYSNLSDTSDYRFVGTAGWRIEMDPEAGLFLELGVEDRYDSNPGTDYKRNDFAYYATVGWSF